jgi:ATP phosphoribosyltransferase regulatory subunit
MDSLLTGTGHDLDIKTFKLIDQVSGRLLGVRADMTPQVARIDARHSEAGVPSRMCYLGTVLHTLNDRLESSRSPMQVGAELYGHAGAASDLEVVALMLEMLAVAGITSVHLDLGHVGLYRSLAAAAGLNPSTESELFEILQRKARPELSEWLAVAAVPPMVADQFAALIELNGGAEVLGQARQRLATADDALHRALDELEGIAQALQRRFPSLPIHFDLAELRGYHYQTGVVFAAFVPGYGREIARGGRYDDVGRVFGHARPATGFSADLRVLLRLGMQMMVGDDAQGTVFAPAHEDESLRIEIRRLRAAGITVICELPGQTASPQDMGCTHGLELRAGAWHLTPVPQVDEVA